MYEPDGTVVRPVSEDELRDLGISQTAANLYSLLCAMCSHSGEVMAGPSLYRWAINVRTEQEAMDAARELEDQDIIEIVERVYGTNANPDVKPHYTFRVVGVARARREHAETIDLT